MDTLSFEAILAGRGFLNELQEGVWIADGQGSIVLANRALSELLGYDGPEALVGKSWRELFPPAEASRFGTLKQQDETRTVRDGAMLRRDSRTIPAAVTVTRRTAGGQVWQVGTALPVAQADPAARSAADAASRQAMDNSIDGICVVERGRVVYANKRFEELTGYTAGQLGRMNLDRVLSPGGRVSLTAVLAEPHRLLSPVHHEVRVVNRAGHELDCELRMAPVEARGGTSANGNANGTALLCFLRDISQLRRAERMQTDFVATVSHELRTPLAAIKEAISLLYDTAGEALPSRPRRYLEIAREEMDRLNRMVANLIESSRMEAGRVVLRVEPVSVEDVLAQSLASLSLLTTKLGLRVERNFTKDLPCVLADRDRLAQVLTNLLDNAIKYSPAGGTLKISARLVEPAATMLTDNDILSDTRYVQVDVSDSGPGIPAEFLTRIFRRFERVDPHGPGMGLGLSIVQTIIQMHHGKVWARSVLGEGTTVSFVLPAKEDRG